MAALWTIYFVLKLLRGGDSENGDAPRDGLSLPEYAVALLSAFWSTSMELTGAVSMVFTCMISLLCFQRVKNAGKKTRLQLFSLLAVLVCFVAVCLLAPGNALRSYAELFWMGAYRMFSSVDQLILGLQHFAAHLYHRDRILMLLLIYLLLIWRERKSIRNLLAVLGGLAANLAVMFCVNIYFSEWYINPYWPLYWAWVVFLITVQVYNALLLYFSFRKDYLLACSLGLIYLAACATDIVVAFSPSVYASGIRVFYECHTFLSVVVALTLMCTEFKTEGAAETAKDAAFILKDKAILCILAATLLFGAGLILLVRHIDIPKGTLSETELSALPLRENTGFSQWEFRDRHGFFQIDVRVEEPDCSAEYHNWVLGTLNRRYLNASLGIRKDDGSMQLLTTYPKITEEDDGTYYIRAYCPSATASPDLQPDRVFLLEYDLEGNALAVAYP